MARSAISLLSGWMTSVTSMAVPPVERLAVLRRKTVSPSGGDAVVVVAVRREQAVGGVVELEAGQHVLVAGAAAGVLVHLGHELGDGGAAVAHDVAGNAVGGGDELAVDDEEAVVVAQDHALDDDARALVDGALEGVGDLGVGGEVHRDAAAVVAVDRLHHHRVADGVGGVDGVLGVADVVLARDRQAEVGEEAGAELLVGGDLDGGVRGLAGQRRLDALLVLALADLDEAGVVEAHPGDVAGLGRADEGEGGGAEGAAAGEMVEVVDRLGDVGALAVARGDELEDDGAGDLAGLEADLLGFVAVEDLDLVGVGGGARHGDLGGSAGAVLERDGDLGHQLAEAAVGFLQPFGERRRPSRWRRRGGRAAGRRGGRGRRHSRRRDCRPGGAGRR